MCKIDKININGIFSIDTTGIITTDITQEKIPLVNVARETKLNLTIKDLDNLSPDTIDNFYMYYRRFYEIILWNESLGLDILKEFGFNLDSSKTTNLHGFIFIPMLYIYTNNITKKTLKEAIKRAWVYLKMLEESKKSYRYSDAKQLVDDLLDYFDQRGRKNPKDLKSFNLFKHLPLDKLKIIRKFRRIYAAYLREFPGKSSVKLRKK